MSQDKDTDFNVPVFISQPEKIDYLYNTFLKNKSDKLYKLQDISVTKMYEYEVFSNSNKNYGLLILFLIIIFIVISKLFFRFFRFFNFKS